MGMNLISHRGNLNGKQSDRENTVSYIEEALNAGYGVEIDVWLKNDNIYLGHDAPDHLIDIDFLKNTNLLCHAKNMEALEMMLTINDIHCFWHQEDTYTLTSKGIPIVYPGKQPIRNSIVMDITKGVNENLISYEYGRTEYNISVCSDYISLYRE
jgi:hypothetical protein